MTFTAKIHFSASIEANPLKLKSAESFSLAKSIAPNPLTHAGSSVLPQSTHYSLGTALRNPSVLELPAQHATAPSALLKISSAPTTQLAREMTHQPFAPPTGAWFDLARNEVNGIKNLLALPTQISNAAAVVANTDVHTLNAALRSAKTDFVNSVTPENLLDKVKNLSGTDFAVGLAATVTSVVGAKGAGGISDVLDGVTNAITKSKKSGVRPDGSIPKNSQLSNDALQHETNRAAALRDWTNEGHLKYEARRRTTMKDFYEGAEGRFQKYVENWRVQQREVAAGFREKADATNTKLNVDLIKARAGGNPEQITLAEQALARHERQLRQLEVDERFEAAIRSKPNGEPVVRSGD